MTAERILFMKEEYYSKKTKISEVAGDACFGDYGRLIFPLNHRYMDGDTLGGLSLALYNNMDPDKTVEIANYLKGHAEAGEKIFYRIYSESEIQTDESKRDAGLFFFRGRPGGRFAVCCAGGAMAFVGAMHDSFPHALELSKKGYNAFALIYRLGSKNACEDLARSIGFLFGHAGELSIDTSCYSLWGGSAGAAVIARVGTRGTAAFGAGSYPKPGAVVMQYIGLSEVTGEEPPTYSCVGAEDPIGKNGAMERRTRAIRANGTEAEVEVFDGLKHGFGLGTGTVAEGWLDRAVSFWEGRFPK